MFIALPRRLPTPARMIHHLDRWAPLRLKRQLLEPQLNQLFGDYIAAGEFDLLEGRFISLTLRDLDISITLTLANDRLQLSQRPGEVEISGDLPTFLQLARQEADADGLFFQRKLLLEGDTELGLGVRNLLDSLEWSMQDSRLGSIALRLEALLRQRLPGAERWFGAA